MGSRLSIRSASLCTGRASLRQTKNVLGTGSTEGPAGANAFLQALLSLRLGHQHDGDLVHTAGSSPNWLGNTSDVQCWVVGQRGGVRWEV